MFTPSEQKIEAVQLTEREKEVLKLIAQEFSTKKATYQEQGWRVVSQYQCGLVFAAVWRK